MNKHKFYYTRKQVFSLKLQQLKRPMFEDYQNTNLYCSFRVVVTVQLEGFTCLTGIRKYQVEVKQSHYRPRQALRVPRGGGSQISRQSAHEGGMVVSPTHRRPLPPGNISGTYFC
jgi:hypothetical protein